jgi:hypothetical protein
MPLGIEAFACSLARNGGERDDTGSNEGGGDMTRTWEREEGREEGTWQGREDVTTKRYVKDDEGT